MADTQPSNYEHEYNSLAEDVLEGSDDDSGGDDLSWDDDKKTPKRGYRAQSGGRDGD